MKFSVDILLPNKVKSTVMFRRFKSFGKESSKPFTLMDLKKEVKTLNVISGIFAWVVTISGVYIHKSYIDATALIKKDIQGLENAISERTHELDRLKVNSDSQICNINKKLDKHDSIILAIKRGIVE